jgi:hypothetical protein
MRSHLLLLFLLTLLITGCQGGLIVPPSPLPTPTAAPTATAPSTPTRADEVVIGYTTIAVNHTLPEMPPTIPPLPPVVGEPEVTVDYLFMPPYETTEGYREPMVFLVMSAQDLEPFHAWLPPETLKAIANVDFAQQAVVVFFTGRKGGGTDGYIERIAARQPDTLAVYGVQRQLSLSTQMSTFPSHVVRIRRQDVPFALSADVRVPLETRVDHIGPQIE